MKNRTDKILLAVLLLSLTLCPLIVLTYLEIIPISRPYWLYSIHAWLALGCFALPAFSLQLLLCRRAKRWIAAIPALVLIGALLWSAYGFFTTTGWETLGWGILLVLSIAPAAGCVLAWAVYSLGKRRRKGDIRNA